jgi:hypothetical protein
VGATSGTSLSIAPELKFVFVYQLFVKILLQNLRIATETQKFTKARLDHFGSLGSHGVDKSVAAVE